MKITNEENQKRLKLVLIDFNQNYDNLIQCKYVELALECQIVLWD